jgi:Flp pilus assembly protein TadG
MHKLNSTSAAAASGYRRIPEPLRRLRLDPLNGEQGSSLVEFAFVLPLFLLIVTGMTTLGIAMNQYLELNNAVTIGAQQLAVSRGDGRDACADAVTAVQNAAPFLEASKVNYTIQFTPLASDNTVSAATFTGDGSNPPTCPSANQDNMDAGGTVQLTATYPCTVTVYGGNLIPGCTLTGSVTEIVQ